MYIIYAINVLDILIFVTVRLSIYKYKTYIILHNWVYEWYFIFVVCEIRKEAYMYPINIYPQQ